MTRFLSRQRTLSRRTGGNRRYARRLLGVERLEDRCLLSAGFSDGFEGPTLDPFWSRFEQSGSVVFPSTAQVHSGGQAVQLSSVNTAQNKTIVLSHQFGDLNYGRFSVWMYDSFVGWNRSNYIIFQIENAALNKYASIYTQNYYYNAPSGLVDGKEYCMGSPGLIGRPETETETPVARTTGWHQFTIDVSPTTMTFYVDGLNVRSEPSFPISSLRLQMSTANYDPAGSTYFDDFSFVPSGNDIAMQSAQAIGGRTIQFTYQTTGDPGPFQVGLYQSANGTSFNPSQPVLTQTVIPGPTNPQAPGTFTLPAGFRPDPALPYLVVAADPSNVIAESNEVNNTAPLLAPKPDLVPLGLSWDESRAAVAFTYKVAGEELLDDATAMLSWATGPTASDIAGPALSVPVAILKTTPVGVPQTVDIPLSALLNWPASGISHLVAVLDPNNAIDEGPGGKGNNVLALAATPTGLAIAPDHGVSASDGLTDTGSVVLSGTMPPLDLTVRVFDEITGTDLGPATVAASTFSVALSLAEGPHRLRVTAQDRGGAASWPAYFNATIDRTAPRIVALDQPLSPREVPVAWLTVAFSEPIDPSTFDYRDLALTRDGGVNLITPAVTVTPLSSISFKVSGLETLTRSLGQYVLAVNAPGLNDLAGNAGVGTAQVFWTHQVSFDFPGQAPPQYATGSRPACVAAADVDGDGRPDLVTADSNSNTVSVLHNLGDSAFAAPVGYAVGTSPSSLAVADVDGDGHVDLVASNGGSNSVSVLRNRGDGTFAAAVSYTVGSNPQAVAAADVDGDGRADVVVANSDSNTVSVLRNRGDGTFAAPVSYSVGSSPQAVAAADMDGDGRADVVVANSDSNTVSVLRNRGDGTFAPQVSYAVGSYPGAVVATDIDGDGHMDLVAANSFANTVSVLRNRGDGTFASQISYLVEFYPQAVTTADVDRDGHVDLVTSGSGSVSVLRSQGDGSFTGQISYTIGFSPPSVTVADVDGDGHIDLVTANNDPNSVSVLRNRGDGTFGSQIGYPVGSHPEAMTTADVDRDGHVDLVTSEFGSVSVLRNKGDGTFAYHASYAVSSGSGGVAAADVDGDGYVDLMVVNKWGNNNTVSVLRNRGNGTFAEQVSYDVGSRPFALAAADVDDDGHIDLVVTNNGSHSVSVLRNRGDGTFAPQVTYPCGYFPGALAATDVDGDGHIDLATTNSDYGTVSVLRNRGDGTFAAPVSYTLGSYSRPSSVVAADVDDDGHIDLVVAINNSSSISVLRNRGDGTFGSPISNTVEFGPDAVTAADLDGDGHVDLVAVSGSSNTVSVLRNRGHGNFAMAVRYAGSYTSPVAAADVDGDGKFDLVAVSGSNSVSVLRNRGDGTFDARLLATAVSFNPPYFVAVADLAKEGTADLIVAYSDSASVAVAHNRGDGTFALPVFYSVGSNPYFVTAGDVDRDGFPDLVTANAGSGTVSILRSRGNGAFDPQVPYAVGSTPYSVAVSDLDDDGAADLVVANYGSNTVSVLRNRGDSTFAPQVTYAVGASPISVSLTDLNGDHAPDLVVANYGSNTVSVLRNRGDGTFAAPVDYAVGINPRSLTVSDLDGDGTPDVAVANTGSNTVSVLHNRGDGTFAVPVNYPVGLGPYSLLAADVNGDGSVDLVAGNYTSSTVSVLRNRGNGTFATQVCFAVGTNPRSVAAADLNKDGTVDLVTADFGDYSLSILLNRIRADSGLPPPPVPLTLAPDRGSSASDGRTNTESVTVSGTLTAAGLTVRLHDETTASDLGAATVSGSTFSLALTLNEGPHRLRATAYDSAGAALAAGSLDVTIDLTAPAIAALRQPSSPAIGSVPYLDVTFTEPIDPYTFDYHDVILTRDGGANLITESISVIQVSTTSFCITNLGALTGLSGQYVLTVVGSGLQDLAGNTATGTAQVAWTGLLGVSNTAEWGPGSLRQAISDANAQPGIDTIRFAIPGTGVQTIALTYSLPTITDTLVLDGTTQPGYAGRPLIELNGLSTGSSSSGLVLNASNCTVRGLVINRFGYYGVSVYGNNNVISGNYIGTNATGTAAFGRQYNGVAVWAGVTNTRIGTNGDGEDDASEGNVLSGNVYNGVYITGTGADNTVIAGNRIGTTADGMAALGNSLRGIYIETGPKYTRIGSNGDGVADSAEGNLISGNGTEGVQVYGTGTDGTVIAGNWIGTTADGQAPLGNGRRGVLVWSGPKNTRIGTDGNGTADQEEGNIISGNSRDGIWILDPGTDGTVVAGNRIGTNASGIAALGNGFNGIQVSGGAKFTRIGTDGNGTADGAEGNLISGNSSNGVLIAAAATVGTTVAGNSIGTAANGLTPLGNQNSGVWIGFGASSTTVGGGGPRSGNVIAFNSGPGIVVESGTGDILCGNLLHGNGGLGIDLGSDGPTPNHATPTAGPNNWQNYPVLLSASAGAAPRVQGTLSSTPGASFFLDFYAGTASALPEARRYLGSATVVTDTAGNASFSLTLAQALAAGESLTATATDSAGNTSELAPAIGVQSSAPPAAPISLAITPDLGTLPNDGLTSTGSITLTGAVAGPGLTVAVRDDTTGADLGQAVVTGTSFALALTLAEGPHHLRAIAADGFGGTSSPSFFDVFIDLTRPAALDVVDVSPDPRTIAVDAIDLVFSEPVDPVSLRSAVALARNGMTLATGGLSFARLGTSTTYRTYGLTSLTGLEGNYTLTVNPAALRDLAGNAGVGAAAVDAWSLVVPAPKDVTSQVTILRGGFRLNRMTGRFVQTVTLVNTGGQFLSGPVSLVLAGLSAGVTLYNRTGTVTRGPLAGNVYLDVFLGSLAPGQSVSVTLEFLNPFYLGIVWDPRVLAGAGVR